MNKLEPLKGKKRTMIGAKPLPEFNFFFVDDVKSAVQGLIEDISLLEFECDEKGNIYVSLTKGKIIDTVKKWFPDIIPYENG